MCPFASCSGGLRRRSQTWRQLVAGVGRPVRCQREHGAQLLEPGSPARLRKNSAAVSTAPTFCATAAAIHWLSDTPSSLASRAAAALTEAGSLRG